MAKDLEYGSISSGKPSKAAETAPNAALIIGCVVVPWAIFAAQFWIRSFGLHWSSGLLANILSCCLFLLPLAFVVLAFRLVNSGGDAKPMCLLAFSAILACTLGFVMGDDNYQTFMKPYYEIKQLNSYPSVDPAKFTGAQLMDAGQITFTRGTQLNLQKSVGFKDRDIYCAAPIVSAGNSTQQTFDFWAVGLNCCSGHAADFHCGDLQNPNSPKGLRLMDDGQRNYFRLAVKKAQAEFNLQVSQPIFLYWIADPSMEVRAHQDDAVSTFIKAIVGFFCLQLVVVLIALVAFAKM